MYPLSMNKSVKTACVVVMLVLCKQGMWSSVYAQQISAADSVAVESFLSQTRESIKRKQYADATQSAKSALDLSKRIGWNKGKAQALFEWGNIAFDQKQLQEAIEHYLQSLVAYEQTSNNTSKRYALQMQIANTYQQMGYFDNAYSTYKKALDYNHGDVFAVYDKMAFCAEKAGRKADALKEYEQLFAKAKSASNKEFIIRSGIELLRLYTASGNSEKVINVARQVIPYVQNDQRNAVTHLQVLNYLGKAYLYSGNGNEALQTILQSQELIKQYRLNQSEAVYDSYLNLGYVNTFLRDYAQAVENYQKAIQWAEGSKNDVLKARALNMLAATYLVSNADIESAISTALQAEQLLKGKNQAAEDQLENYLLLNELYQKNNDFEASKTYYQFYQEQKSRLDNEIKKQEELIVQSRLAVERKENEIRLLQADEIKQNLEANKAKLEAEQRQKELLLKQKELDILKRNQELQEINLKNQMLEQQRVKQQLLLTRQQLESDQKNKEILELQKNKEIQDLQLRQQELKEQENQKAIQLLESQKKIQNLQIEEQNRNRKVLIGVVGVGSLLFLITGLSFWQKRRDNQKLAQQKRETEAALAMLEEFHRDIQEKNEQLIASEEEMRQNAEELQATNETLMATQVKLQKTIEELQATQDHLVQSEKMASLGQLVAGISHEINTPIGVAFTAITYSKDFTDKFNQSLASGEKLKKSDLDRYIENVTESTSIIYDNLKRASELIASFKKVSVDQSHDDLNTFELKKYLKDIFNSLTPELRKGKITTRIEGPDDLKIKSFPSAFSQVIINFVMNSIKHAFEDSDQKEKIITVNFMEHNDKIHLTFEDNGKGIPPENIARIFDPFFTTKRNAGGSGLGLHIVYNLITQKLKATVECTSEPGRYTRFKLTLPKSLN